MATGKEPNSSTTSYLKKWLVYLIGFGVFGLTVNILSPSGITGFAAGDGYGGCADNRDIGIANGTINPLRSPSQWDPKNDNPEDFPDTENNFTKKWADLPTSGAASSAPWAGSYWPTYEDNINFIWDGDGSESPAAKYGEAFGIDNAEDKISKAFGIDSQSGRTACTENEECDKESFEKCAKREGKESGYCIPSWWGICHAWAPASIRVAEPKYPVTKNGVTFKVNDIKALISLAYNNTSSKESDGFAFVSGRCNTDTSEFSTTEMNQPTASECRDSNAGTFHLLMANWLGIKKRSFVIDRTLDYEVWNQPLRDYELLSVDPIANAYDANKLAGVMPEGGIREEFSGELEKGKWEHLGPFNVSVGQDIQVSMSAGKNQDLDLYVRYGSQPSGEEFDCRPYTNSGWEECSMKAQADTQLYVSVSGYAKGSYNVKIGSGTVSSNYEINPLADRFYKINSKLRFITESDSGTDGNLSETINSYTKDLIYNYIIEVDAEGKINGGEWIGSSKGNHPDFFWTATKPSYEDLAGRDRWGKVTAPTGFKVSKILELAEASLHTPGSAGNPGDSDPSVNSFCPAGTSETAGTNNGGFDWGNACEPGCGSFNQDIAHKDVITVGDIAKGKLNIRIELKSDKDVDIRLKETKWTDDPSDDTYIIAWTGNADTEGFLNGPNESCWTDTVSDIEYCYSGYNGVDQEMGHEWIEIRGVTNQKLVMEAFGYAAGNAAINYRWYAPDDCVDAGSGDFQQAIALNEDTVIGDIPAGKSNIRIELRTDGAKDVDVRVKDKKSGEFVIAWTGNQNTEGNLNGSAYECFEHSSGVEFCYSGYNGVDGNKGHEYITIKGRLDRPFTMSAFGYRAGSATVKYGWGIENVEDPLF